MFTVVISNDSGYSQELRFASKKRAYRYALDMAEGGWEVEVWRFGRLAWCP